jgi:hypothetical protein
MASHHNILHPVSVCELCVAGGKSVATHWQALPCSLRFLECCTHSISEGQHSACHLMGGILLKTVLLPACCLLRRRYTMHVAVSVPKGCSGVFIKISVVQLAVHSTVQGVA